MTWRKVTFSMQLPLYIISDIHLMLQPSKSEGGKISNLFQFFDFVAQSKGTLIINGDLFDFYYEYQHVIPKQYFDIYVQLQKLTQAGIEVHFFTWQS